MSGKRLPCPFCGSKAKCEQSHTTLVNPKSIDGGIRYMARPVYAVSCRNIDCLVSASAYGPSPAIAWKRWNTRAKPYAKPSKAKPVGKALERWIEENKYRISYDVRQLRSYSKLTRIDEILEEHKP